MQYFCQEREETEGDFYPSMLRAVERLTDTVTDANNDKDIAVHAYWNTDTRFCIDYWPCLDKPTVKQNALTLYQLTGIEVSLAFCDNDMQAVERWTSKPIEGDEQ